MAKIISIVQVKGGAGRSTLATNLAALISPKLSTLLIDCDMPQGTSASWFSVRQASGKSGKLDLKTVQNHKDLVQLVDQVQGHYQCIVIDTPPRIAEVTRAALIMGDLTLVPIGASIAEIWATSDLIKTIEEARAHKPKLDARVIWTRFRGYTLSAQELSKAVKQELSLPELKSKLGYRVAYSDALGQGMGVHEWTDRNAREEITALGNEVVNILKGKR